MYQGCFNITKWTRDIIQPNIDRILPKVNQVIYTLETTCMLNIMTLAQVVTRSFMGKMPKSEKRHNLLKYS